MLAAFRSARCEQRAERRFSRAGSALEQRARAALEPASQERVEAREAALHAHARGTGPVLRCHQPRIDFEPAPPDRVVVIAAAKVAAAVLGDGEAPALAAEGG